MLCPAALCQADLLCAVLCTFLHWLWLGCFALFNMHTYDIKLCQAAVSCNTLAHLPAAPRTACHTGLHPSLLGHLCMSIHPLTAHLCHKNKALAWLLVRRTRITCREPSPARREQACLDTAPCNALASSCCCHR